MGVYLYPSGTETELKNAYIGGVYEYSYDFVGKTISQIANDWWQWTSWWTNTSDGIYRNSWGNPMYISLAWMHTALATATKVTMKIWVYVTKWTWTRDVACRVWDSWKANAYFWVYFGWQNTDNNFAGTSGWTTYSYTWATVFTLIYDLVNKTLSISSTDGNSITPNTYSLTDSYIASVVNGERIYIQQNWTYSKMKSVSLTIEL